MLREEKYHSQMIFKTLNNKSLLKESKGILGHFVFSFYRERYFTSNLVFLPYAALMVDVNSFVLEK